MFTWNAHEEAVTALAFGPDGRFLVSAGADECVKIWDPITGAEQSCISLRVDELLRLPGDAVGPLHHLVVSSDGTHAVVAQPAVGLVFLDLVQQVELLSLPLGKVEAVKPAPDGDSVVALFPHAVHPTPDARQYAFGDGTSVKSAKDVSDYSCTYASRSLAFSPDGSFIALGTSVYPWPPSSATWVHVWMKDYEPEDLAFSADNSHLFALVGGKIVVYALPDGLFKTKLKGHDGRITAMALAPDGRRLWTASRDATVKCWDTFSLTLDRTFTFQTGGLDCLAVSPDGNVAAVGSGQKGTITLWDLG